MKPAVLAILLCVAFAGWAQAVEPAERLADPAQEARARAISRELRCLVCQNESIDELGADLAHDIRVLLRQRIAAGDSDAQAVDYIVARYGQFVLLKPPVEPATYILWFGPPLLLVAGALGLLLRARRRGTSQAPTPLTTEERERLAQLLKDGGR